jgi:hypothetical protein
MKENETKREQRAEYGTSTTKTKKCLLCVCDRVIFSFLAVLPKIVTKSPERSTVEIYDVSCGRRGFLRDVTLRPGAAFITP